MGDPEKARSVLEKIFGPKILSYAGQAWNSDDQDKRIALCHLATLDPDVVLAPLYQPHSYQGPAWHHIRKRVHGCIPGPSKRHSPCLDSL